MASSGWRRRDSRDCQNLLVNLEGTSNGEEQAARQPAAFLRSRRRTFELPAAARKSYLPLSRSGAGGFPPRRWHAVCQPKALAPIDAAAPPARGVSKRFAETPLAYPPGGRQKPHLKDQHQGASRKEKILGWPPRRP